jgi:hypothetical protein
MEAIEKRFSDINQCTISTPLTLWESVLQEFLVEGGVHNSFWLKDVEGCLKLRLTRDVWEQLAAELGPSVMGKVTDWVRQNVTLLPGDIDLPNTPDQFENKLD